MENTDFSAIIDKISVKIADKIGSGIDNVNRKEHKQSHV